MATKYMESENELGVKGQGMTQKTERLYELDLLRFLAAIAIVMFHWTFRGFLGDMTIVEFPGLSIVSKYGYFAVPLFFMISGFVVFLTSSGRTWSEFVIARMSRLYPAYWVCVTLTFVATLVIGAPYFHATVTQYIINLSMLQSFVGVRSMDGVYWTLAVELRFYFLVFLLLATKQMRYAKNYIIGWLLLSLFLTAYPIKYVNFLVLPDWSWCFASGAGFYLAYREGISPKNVVTILLSGILGGWTMYVRAGAMSQGYNTHFSVAIVWSILAVYFLLFSLIAWHKTRFIRKKSFLVLGALTYPLFLVHQDIGYMLSNRLYGWLDRYLILVVLLTGMIGISLAISRYIADPVSRTLRKGLIRGSSRLLG